MKKNEKGIEGLSEVLKEILKEVGAELFVVYRYEKLDGSKGIANASLTVPFPPQNFEQILAIEMKIEDEEELESATILNWKVFGE